MLALTNISKKFNNKNVLNNVTFSLNNSEVVGLIGPNGAGKTTVFKLITDEISPDSGSIQTHNEKVGYLPQHPQFNELTVGEFLESKLDNQNLQYKTDRALNMLGLSNIDKSQKADSLSGGQKTRLYLASLILTDLEPTILLLDEPTNNLDIEGLKGWEN